MRRLLTLGAVCAVVAGITWTAAQAADAPKPASGPKKIQVLLITGDDVGVHHWRETSQATRAILEKSGRFDVRVCEDPGILESRQSLLAFDVILFHMYNKSLPTITDTAKENLLNFVRPGKGFVVQHLASASFADWPEFGKLCGRYWKMKTSGHGPRAPFEAKIAKADHPITQGLSGFTADDELYAKLQGDTPIEVLVTADSAWSHKTEPLAFVHTYGAGRVFNNCFGHDVKALENPTIQQLIVRGTEWAATGAVK